MCAEKEPEKERFKEHCKFLSKRYHLFLNENDVSLLLSPVVSTVATALERSSVEAKAVSVAMSAMT